MSTPRLRKVVDLVVRWVVPASDCEAFLGDLIEEWDNVIRPELGPRRATWWLGWQILGSVPPMLRLRLAKGIRMTPMSIKTLTSYHLTSPSFDARFSLGLNQVGAVVITSMAVSAVIRYPGTRADLAVGLALAAVESLLLSLSGFASWYLVRRLSPPPLKQRWPELASYLASVVLMIGGIKSLPTEGLRPAAVTLWILTVCSLSLALILGGLLTTILRSPRRSGQQI